MKSFYVLEGTTNACIIVIVNYWMCLLSFEATRSFVYTLLYLLTYLGEFSAREPATVQLSSLRFDDGKQGHDSCQGEALHGKEQVR